jgi:hypothetical protein
VPRRFNLQNSVLRTGWLFSSTSSSECTAGNEIKSPSSAYSGISPVKYLRNVSDRRSAT